MKNTGFENSVSPNCRTYFHIFLLCKQSVENPLHSFFLAVCRPVQVVINGEEALCKHVERIATRLTRGWTTSLLIGFCNSPRC